MSERGRVNLLILLLVLGMIAASIFVVTKRETKLGLDLQGGVQLIYEAQPSRGQVVTPESMQRALELMRERVDQFGVAEPELLLSGENQLEISLPGVDDPERVAEQIGQTAEMVFYDWEKNVLDEDCETNPDVVNGDTGPIQGLYQAVQRASECGAEAAAEADVTGDPEFFAFDEQTKQPLADGIGAASREDLLDALDEDERERAEILKVPAGIVLVRDERPAGPPGSEERPDRPDRWWLLLDRPVLTGKEIREPEQNFDPVSNEPVVTMEYTDKGRSEFEQATAEIAQRGADNAAINGMDPLRASHHFAIVLDEELISRPYINYVENPEGIRGNSSQISGGFQTAQEAQDLARLLQVGALPVELQEISQARVSATLGKQALSQGLIAGIAGFGIVALFLIGFYRMLGVIATIALGIYALYLYALVELIPVTLTLPGIAGMILTIGVAADANIVIFERVKEEIRAGRGIVAGIAAGYRKGFATIVDANVVTLLVAFILFVLATAGVRGFAFMLGLGTIVSLITAVFATRAILMTLRGASVLNSREAIGAGEQKHRWTLDFMGASRWFFSISGVILLIGAFAIAGNGLNLGIDFESGARYTASLERDATVEQVRDALPPDLQNSEVQELENPDIGENVFQISTEETGLGDAVSDRLEDSFGLTENVSSTEIGPTFGTQVAESALLAIFASLLVISVYIALRFEWKFAVPVLIALIHDLLITAGVYALLGREVTTSTVAALLTILGFSLYDTIIVFDRIRENIPRMPNAAFSQIVNRSMSEVLTRSLATSFCTLLPVLALMLFGGETLQDFAFALLVGIASGTYSSVFIAGPMLTHWKSREPVYRSRIRRIREQLGHVPAYAVALPGAPADVAPRDSRKPRRASLSDRPEEVSKEEFDDLVADLGVEPEAAPRSGAVPAGTAASARPAGGRRARAQGNGARAVDESAARGDERPPEPGNGAGDAASGETGTPRPKRPRNKRHGRPR